MGPVSISYARLYIFVLMNGEGVMVALARLAAGFGSLCRSAISGLLNFLFPSLYEPARKYQPEKHYMRGPGPKWCAKHGRNVDRISAT